MRDGANVFRRVATFTRACLSNNQRQPKVPTQNQTNRADSDTTANMEGCRQDGYISIPELSMFYGDLGKAPARPRDLTAELAFGNAVCETKSVAAVP